MKNQFNAIFTIAARDITKLFRDKTRIVANFIFPIVFIGVLGTSLQSSLQDKLNYNFLSFVFLGVVAQTLFQSTAGGIISIVEDRQTDFAQELFVSPISRYSIVIGKILGEVLVAFVQVTGVLAFGLLFGVPLDWLSLVKLIPAAILIAFFGGAFGLFVMANLSEQRSANQIFPFILFPQFFLAGVFNPMNNVPTWMMIASKIAPMTYAVDLIRGPYYWGKPEFGEVVLHNPLLNLAVIAIASTIFIIVGTYMFVRNERNR